MKKLCIVAVLALASLGLTTGAAAARPATVGGLAVPHHTGKGIPCRTIADCTAKCIKAADDAEKAGKKAFYVVDETNPAKPTDDVTTD